ncbi:hypothetical protein V6N12_063596 [Hibiscus sabdariffa]|uniref:Uncharacterized protein n=1 Tax=Hibiscus sabdariffa TaxID=183260 RepID=A0ABR2FC95_9ROSI
MAIEEDLQSPKKNRHSQVEEFDAINAILLGKENIDSGLNDILLLSGQIGDFQFMSDGLKVINKKEMEDEETLGEVGALKQGNVDDQGISSKSQGEVGLMLSKGTWSQDPLILTVC